MGFIDWVSGLGKFGSLVVSIIKIFKKEKPNVTYQSGTVSGRSTLVQSSGANTNVSVGLTYNEVEKMVLLLFENNFPRLSQEAAETATKRVRALTGAFLAEIGDANWKRLRDPDMQNTLFNAQLEFAKFGDEHLKEVLVDILSERIKVDPRTLEQIFYDEAIRTIPKLTNWHLDVLALNFLFKKNRDFFKTSDFDNYLSSYLVFSDSAKANGSATGNYLPLRHHLNYLGCITDQYNGGRHSNYYDNTYRMCVSNEGFYIGELRKESFYDPILENLIVPHFEYQGKYQAVFKTSGALKEFGVKNGLDESVVQAFLKFVSDQGRSSKQLEFLSRQFPAMVEVENILDCVPIVPMTLFGEVIAEFHLNAKTRRIYIR